MLSTLRQPRLCATSSVRHNPGMRTFVAAIQGQPQPHHQTIRDRGPRKEGDISSVFASLSGASRTPLPPRFAVIKQGLIRNHETALVASWERLLSSLRSEIDYISSIGSSIVPEIRFSELRNHSRTHAFSVPLRKRGAAIIRGVVSEQEALGWKEEIKAYVAKNPHTKAFPKDKPAVFELYWSPSQIKARAHPNLLEAQRFLMSFWHSNDPNAWVDTERPVAYADRLRIRQPGDAGFALGPHVDGGSVERWEPEGYGRSGVYDKIWEGKWEEFDPWESSNRLRVESDLYNGAGACSMFRMFQGWLSLSHTGPGEGTLLVNPLFKLATAYFLLRPFFTPRDSSTSSSEFFDASNWNLDTVQTPILQGATLGCTQELTSALHPHLELDKSMVHIPRVHPGDYVAWHCDTIHAVDRVHKGNGDSSVLYIPACPLTEVNARYLVRQREAFLNGTPGPDFPGGEGERRHIGRMTAKDVIGTGSEAGVTAMGLASWKTTRANKRGFYGAMNEIVS